MYDGYIRYIASEVMTKRVIETARRDFQIGPHSHEASTGSAPVGKPGRWADDLRSLSAGARTTSVTTSQTLRSKRDRRELVTPTDP